MFVQRCHQRCLAHFTSMDICQSNVYLKFFMCSFVANTYFNKVGYFCKYHGSHQTNRQNSMCNFCMYCFKHS